MPSPALISAFGANAADGLAKVKSGWSKSDALPTDYIWMFGVGLLLLVLAGLAVTVILKKRRRRFGIWVSITDPERIAAIFHRATARQAQHTLEIYNASHNEIYHGHFNSYVEGRSLTLDLSVSPKIDLNFKSLPAQVHMNFRPGPNENMEHYQFNTHTIDIEFIKEKDWRTAAVSVAWPKSLVSAQRRNYLRLEPVGDHAMECDLCSIPLEQNFNPASLKTVSRGKVLDISLGGLRLGFAGRLRMGGQGGSFIGVMDLPLASLGLNLADSRLYCLMQVISCDYVGVGDFSAADRKAEETAGGQGESAAAQESSASGARTIVTARFLGRYRRQPVAEDRPPLWRHQAFSLEAFQDLSYWLNACQRFQLQKESGLQAAGQNRPSNRYPSIPPARPAGPLSSGPDDGQPADGPDKPHE